MVQNSEKYQKARDFRKRGFTYSEISKIVGVSKGTLSSWFAKKDFSKKIKQSNELRARRDNVKRIALLNKYRTLERQKRYQEAIKSAEVEYKHYKSSPLFMAGLMLYVSEGDRVSGRPIRITHSNSDLHRIFIKFCFEFLGVKQDDVHFWLLLYPNMSEKSSKKVWAKELKLPEDQFYKSQVVQGKSKESPLHNGVGNTIIGDAYLKKKLIRWCELASKELMK